MGSVTMIHKATISEKKIDWIKDRVKLMSLAVRVRYSHVSSKIRESYGIFTEIKKKS